MSTTLENSIWPNKDGNLGNIKVQIPDGVNVLWPDGDALVENFVYKDGKLVGFVDTKALINNNLGSTTFPYDFVEITLSNELENSLIIIKGERNKYLNIKFLSGADAIVLPVGYKRLEYLESVGHQHIVKNFESNTKETIIEAEFQCTAYYGTSVICGSTPHQPFLAINSNGYNSINTVFLGHNKNHGKCLWRDGNYVKKWYNDIFAEEQNNVNIADSFNAFQLFALNGLTFPFRGKIFNAKMYIEDVLTTDFIPCLNETGTPCMFDTVTQTPFYNNGTGDFLYPGSESQVVTSSIDDKFYAKMTEHGIQRLYKIPDNYSGTKDDYASEYGFKEIVEPPMPTDGNWSPQWTETDTQLICNWVEAEEITLES